MKSGILQFLWLDLVRVQTAKQLLKKFAKFSQRQFANIVTGDEK